MTEHRMSQAEQPLETLRSARETGWPRTAAYMTALAAVLAVAAGPARAADEHGHSIAKQVRNADTCLPSLADPPDDVVRFKDGKYSSSAIPFAEMRAIASGELNGHRVAVTEITWNTGGSGNWEIVELFREVDGKAVSQGIYWPASDLPDGGTMVGRIEIHGDEIRLYGDDSVHHRKITEPLTVDSSVFKPCRTAAPD